MVQKLHRSPRWGNLDYVRHTGLREVSSSTVNDVNRQPIRVDEQGHMITGWQDISTNTYYFRSSGATQTSEVAIDDTVHMFNGKVVMVGC